MVGAQLAVLVNMVVLANLPLWRGQEIRLATVPIDPRSLFRGDYVVLGYEISNIPKRGFADPDNLRHGEPVYVRLWEDKTGVHRYFGAGLEVPREGPFLRGRLQYPRVHDETFAVRYGLEALFAAPATAKALEQQVREGEMVSIVMVDADGKGALKNLVPLTDIVRTTSDSEQVDER